MPTKSRRGQWCLEPGVSYGWAIPYDFWAWFLCKSHHCSLELSHLFRPQNSVLSYSQLFRNQDSILHSWFCYSLLQVIVIFSVTLKLIYNSTNVYKLTFLNILFISKYVWVNCFHFNVYMLFFYYLYCLLLCGLPTPEFGEFVQPALGATTLPYYTVQNTKSATKLLQHFSMQTSKPRFPSILLSYGIANHRLH